MAADPKLQPYIDRAAQADKIIQDLTGRVAFLAGGGDLLKDNLRLHGDNARLEAELAESMERERKLTYQLNQLQRSLAAAEGGGAAPKAAAPAKKTAQQIAEEEDEAAAKKQKNAYVLAPTKKSEAPAAAAPAVFVDQTIYDDDLALGKPAPSLDSLTWVRGDPIKYGANIVVVYFWAKYDTLGYPAIQHFSNLQKKYRSIRLVGVNIDPKIEDVNTFLNDPKFAEFASKIDFTVAWDGGKKLYNAFREVSGVVINLPHGFVIDKSGTIVWREVFRPTDSKCLFMSQTAKCVEGKPLAQNGPKPTEEDEVADVPDDMSLF